MARAGQAGPQIAIGERLVFPAPDGEIALEAEVLERGEFGERLLRFEPVDDFFAVLDRIGHMPLPPYIRRDDADADRERYQTVFSRERGSVAAPTAGCTLRRQMLDALAARGVEIARITLHVGLGTFAPLRVERWTKCVCIASAIRSAPQTAEAVNRAVARGPAHCRRRHHGCAHAGALRAAGARAGPAARTPARRRSSSRPASISAGQRAADQLPPAAIEPADAGERLCGARAVLAAYRHAVEEKYRFFSYGDCMFIRVTASLIDSVA